MLLKAGKQEYSAIFHFAVELLNPHPCRMLGMWLKCVVVPTEIVGGVGISSHEIGTEAIGEARLKIHVAADSGSDKSVVSLRENAVAVGGHIIWGQCAFRSAQNHFGRIIYLIAFGTISGIIPKTEHDGRQNRQRLKDFLCPLKFDFIHFLSVGYRSSSAW